MIQSFVILLLFTSLISFAQAEEETLCSDSKKHMEKQLDRPLVPTQRLDLLIQLAEHHWQIDEQTKAKKYAQEAVNLARTQVSTSLAHALNTQGNVLTAQKDYSHALESYQAALTQNQDAQFHARVWVNLAQLWFDVGLYADTGAKKSLYQNHRENLLSKSFEALKTAQKKLDSLPDDENKVLGILHLFHIAQSMLRQWELSQERRTDLIKTTDQALLRLALNTKIPLSPNTKSYLKGYLGEFYQRELRFEEALQLTRQAIFFAQEIQANDTLYLWERQLAQLYQQKGDVHAAIKAYQRALHHLNKVRTVLLTMPSNKQVLFSESTMGQTYLQLNTLLLQQADHSSSDDHQRQCFLNQAQEVIEQFKETELDDYLRDVCSVRKSRIEEYRKSSVLDIDCATNQAFSDLNPYFLSNGKEQFFVLYPIIYSDHLDLLLRFSKNIIHIQIPVTKTRLEKVVYALLRGLTSQYSDRDKILTDAYQLYQWIIQPIEAHLEGTETVMIIPDGILRAIPFAVLYDGQRYLFEKYALATTLNLTFTNDHQASKPTEILLAGLSSEELAYAPRELKALQQIYRHADKLEKDFFTKENFQDRIETKLYDVIHLATHGQFKENPQKTAVEAFGKTKIDLQDFQRLAHLYDSRSHPIELLTLSACETAQGNDRAALGLAGMTVKAGVKSVLASLWEVNDLSTCYLIEAFYQHFNQGMSKAKALQQAQKQLLHPTSSYKGFCGESPKEDFMHPFYWSAFILIGNWH